MRARFAASCFFFAAVVALGAALVLTFGAGSGAASVRCRPIAATTFMIVANSAFPRSDSALWPPGEAFNAAKQRGRNQAQRGNDAREHPMPVIDLATYWTEKSITR
jgi:hypothetical protein